MQSCLLCICFC